MDWHWHIHDYPAVRGPFSQTRKFSRGRGVQKRHFARGAAAALNIASGVLLQEPGSFVHAERIMKPDRGNAQLSPLLAMCDGHRETPLLDFILSSIIVHCRRLCSTTALHSILAPLTINENTFSPTAAAFTRPLLFLIRREWGLIKLMKRCC